MKENKIPELLRWTNASIYCFERNCVCKDCIYKKNLETECSMKKTVLALFSKFGKPEDKSTKTKKRQLFVTKYYGYDTQKLKLAEKMLRLRRKILSYENSELIDIFAEILNIIQGLILFDDAEAQTKEAQNMRLEKEINLIYQKNFKKRKENSF